jgi:Methyltransferase FkbM domain
MKRQLKTTLTKALGLANAFPTRMTAQAALRSLLERLHPISPDRELIRLGPKGDGGYLVPDDLDGISACMSPGVNFESGFEKACADRGMKVFLADKSVDRPAEEHPLFHFSKMFVGAVSNDEFMTLDDWVNTSVSEPDSDLLLQIDIEGYEYEVLLSTSHALMRRFRMIVAEFHQLDQLWSEPFFNLASRAFDKILQTHTCVHTHPNNCCGSIKKAGLEIPRVMEFTFVRNDRISRRTHQTHFPHPLDSDNTANPALPLPSCWYRE